MPGNEQSDRAGMPEGKKVPTDTREKVNRAKFKLQLSRVIDKETASEDGELTEWTCLCCFVAQARVSCELVSCDSEWYTINTVRALFCACYNKRRVGKFVLK